MDAGLLGGEELGDPILLRYLLQVCDTVSEAVAVLTRVPCHMAYTVTLLEPSGAFATVFLAPDQPAVVTSRRVATNHQGAVHWPQHAVATGSVDRLRVLTRHLHRPQETAQAFASRFLEPPAWSDPATMGWGTLYTAVYRPVERSLELRWPRHRWVQSIAAFEEQRLTIPG